MEKIIENLKEQIKANSTRPCSLSANDAKAILAELEWISVDERLPEVLDEPVRFLVVYEGGVYIGTFTNFGRPMWKIAHIHSAESLNVTHWKPLPKPPTK